MFKCYEITGHTVHFLMKYLNLHIGAFGKQKDKNNISETRYKENPVQEFKNCLRKFLNCIKSN